MNWVWPMAPAQDPVSGPGGGLVLGLDLQGGDQLRAPVGRARRLGAGQRRQGAQDGADDPGILEDAAVGGFDPPEGRQDEAVDAVSGLDGVEGRGPLRQLARAPRRSASR